jgi:HSP20 family protein
MSNPTRWNPRRELANLRDNMNRLLEEGFASVGGVPALAVDVYETSDTVVVQAGPLAGIQAEDIDVSITGDTLTIRGETREETESSGVNYLRKERRFGSFSRSITIPRPIKAEEAAASFKNGILTITIPKAESAQPKVIDVTTEG